MVTLRHTPGLHVPHDRLRVGSVSRRSTYNGEAVTAQLTINGLIVGLIENDGNGGLTELVSPNDLFGWQRMHAYRTASRHHGDPIDEDRLLDALVTEAELDKAIAGLQPGATLARLIDAGDYTVDNPAGSCRAAQPGRRAPARRDPAAPPYRYPLADLVRPRLVRPLTKLTRRPRERTGEPPMKDRPWHRRTPPSLATPQPGGCGIGRRNHAEQPADADNDTARPTPPHSGDPAGNPADAQARWQATLQRLRDAAAEAGRNAADWWAQDAIGGRATGDVQATAARVLAGIDDGDPAALDLLPRLDESGQQEDGLSAAERYTAATGPADTTRAVLDEPRRDEATNAYRDAFDTAALDRITDLCRQVVEPEPPHRTPGTEPTSG